MSEDIAIHAQVALTEDIPEVGLVRGQIGTVVHVYEPGVFEVEFSDESGEAFAFATLNSFQLLLLRRGPVQAA